MADRESDAQPRFNSEPLANIEGWPRAVLGAALLYLAARLVYLAFHIDPALPPDEMTHLGFARHHADYLGLAEDTPASAVHGLISHRPFLYSWVLGRWLQIHGVVASLVGPDILRAVVSDLVWARLANIAFAFVTVIAGLAFVRRAGASAGGCALFVVLLTNVPMWSFLSASVNYDNAAMALSTVSFALLARYLDSASQRTLVWLVAALLAGVLTKTAFIPAAALLVGAALVASRGTILGSAAAALRSPAKTGFAAIGVVAVLGSLALGIYGRNLAKFGLLEPAPNQVLSLEAANRNRIFRQEHVLRSFRAGAIDFRQATNEISAIEHEGDRAGAMWMLRRARELRDDTGEPIAGRIAYAPTWTSLMADRVFGVMGHRPLYKTGALRWAYLGSAVLGLLALAWQLRLRNVHLRIAAAVSGGYALILMQAVNYPIYAVSGVAEDAVQGRYLFPVLAPLLGGGIIACANLLPRPARLAIGVAVAALFIVGDFPYLLRHASAEWFGAP